MAKHRYMELYSAIMQGNDVCIGRGNRLEYSREAKRGRQRDKTL